MLHGLANARPDWLPEVVAHWLRRRLTILQQGQVDGQEIRWRDLFNHDGFGAKQLHPAAEKHPELFAQHVLPVVLDISDTALYGDETKTPRRDEVWYTLFKSGHPSMRDACLNAVVTALQKLAQENPESVRGHIETLKPRTTFTANYLLLNLYTAAAQSFADEAIDLLCIQPWRLNCGYSGSDYWVAMELIRETTPHCSPENLARLETVLLNYSSDYEKTAQGRHTMGHSQFTLLSAVPENLRSKNAQSRFQELERKFGKPDSPPQVIQAYLVGSPIPTAAGEKMTDEQWLRAIAKYRTDDQPNPWDQPERGGAAALATMLGEFVRKEPERFARLSLTFPPKSNPTYIERVLGGVQGTEIPTTLKLDVCRKVFAEARVECGTVIADSLGSMKEPLPDDAVEMLRWLATEHPDPTRDFEEEQFSSSQDNHASDKLPDGFNSTRGRAAHAIRDLILTDESYINHWC